MADERPGFAGFESLVTNLSDLPAPPKPPAEAPAPRAVASAADRNGLDLGLPPPRPEKQWRPEWIAALAVVGIVVLVAIVNSDKRAPVTVSFPTTTYPLPTPSSPQYAPVRPAVEAEEMPPFGQDVLSSAQLRYCLSQAIRIEGADKVANTASHADVDRFNGLVDDYNPRCAKVRYRTSVFNSVKPEVEARRAALEQEGEALIRRPAYTR